MSTAILGPILAAGAAVAALTLSPVAGAAGAEDCDHAGAATACAPMGQSAVVGTRLPQGAGYWPFSAQSGDSPSPTWVME